MTQVEMNQAEAEYAAYWDRLLATEEVKFLATCDEKRAQLFHRAQQAWRAHLSADADLAADKARGGTMSAMIHAGRRASMIERRVEFLRDLAYEP